MGENKNLPHYLLIFFIIIVLKLKFATAQTDDLIFILYPLSTLVDYLTGLSSSYVSNHGFLYHSLDIIIDKSCSGYNYWMISFGMLAVLSMHYFETSRQKLMVVLFCFIGAFFFMITVNAFRIYALILIHDFPISGTNLVHEGMGILMYFTFLLILYIIVENLLKKRYRYEEFV